MERAREEIEFIERRGKLPQQPAVCSRLFASAVGQRRVAMRCDPALDIVLAFAVPDHEERKGLKRGHRLSSIESFDGGFADAEHATLRLVEIGHLFPCHALEEAAQNARERSMRDCECVARKIANPAPRPRSDIGVVLAAV